MVLLQRPTMLYPFSVLGYSAIDLYNRMANPSASYQASELALLRSFVSSGETAVQIDSPSSSLRSLCTLSLLVSHGRRLPGSMSRYQKMTDAQISGSSQGWQHEFLELALQSWLSSHSITPSSDTLMLYHTIHLSIYSNFAEVGRAAQFALTQKASTTSRSCATLPRSVRGQPAREESRLEPSQPLPSEICFTSEEDHEKAAWHAIRILQVAHEIETNTDTLHGEIVHPQKQTAEVKGEVIHYSHAVYYATMVLWCSVVFRTTSHCPGESGKDKSTSTSDILLQGTDLLARSASQVAVVFRKILCSLEPV